MGSREKELAYTVAIILQKLATALADLLWLVLLAELIEEVIPDNGITGSIGKMAQYVLGLLLLSAWKRMGYSFGRSLTLKLQNLVRFRYQCRMVEKIAKVPYRLLTDYTFCELEQGLRNYIEGSEHFVWAIMQKSGNIVLYFVRILGMSLWLAAVNIPLGIFFFLLEICHCLMTALGVEQEDSFAVKNSPGKRYLEELALGRESAGERSLFSYVGYIAGKHDREERAVRKAYFTLQLEYRKTALSEQVLVVIVCVLTQVALAALLADGRMSLGYYIALSAGAISLLEKNEEGNALRYLQRVRTFVKQWHRFMDLPETEETGGVEGAGSGTENGSGEGNGSGEENGSGTENGSREENGSGTENGNREARKNGDRNKEERRNGNRKENQDGNKEECKKENQDRNGNQDRKENKNRKRVAEGNRHIGLERRNEGAVREFETLEFRKVSFRYPRTGRYVLHDLNFSLTKGGYYAFVGANGSGKTTIVKLLSGLYDNYEGEILLNGIELRKIPFQERRRIFAILFQDAARYEDTIVRNIMQNNPQAINGMDQGSDIRRLAEELVEQWTADGNDSFPRGINTFLGSLEEDGVILSTGQWQQLLIARELVQPAQIRVMDEPMASLDIFRQGRILERFTRDAENCTTLLFSHHMAAVRKAKRIFVLKEGILVEEGSHDLLMEENGLYAKLYGTQGL